jgi:hypothetical protein
MHAQEYTKYSAAFFGLAINLIVYVTVFTVSLTSHDSRMVYEILIFILEF